MCFVVGALVASACSGDDTESDSSHPDASETAEATTGTSASEQSASEETTDDATDESAAPTESESSTSQSESSADGAPQYGGELVIANTTEPGPLHPLNGRASFTIHTMEPFMDTLLTIDESGTLQPNLATGYSTPDEGTTWVLELNDGIVFHDGTPLTAQIVADLHNELKDPANQCVCLGAIALLQTVEATGDLEVTYTLSAPSAAFPAQFAGGFGFVTLPGRAPTDDPIGTGAFVFESSDGQTITGTRNDNYWKEGLPYADSVKIVTIPDVASQISAIQAGDVTIGTMRHDLLGSIEGDDSIARVEYGGFGNLYMYYNVANPPFDDLRARQAVAYALDLETFHDTVNFGAVEPATSIYSRTSWAYPGEIEAYPLYDPDRAAALVDELGGLSFTLLAPMFYESMVVALQGQLAAVGIDVTLDVRENAAAIDAYRSHNFQVVFSGYSGSVDPSDWTAAYRTESGLNSGLYSNPEMDALIDEAVTLIDQNERAAVYKQIAELAAIDLPILVINNYNDSYLAAPNLRGITATPDGWYRPEYLWFDRP